MKPVHFLAALAWALLFCAAAGAVDPRKVLDEARSLAGQGKYEKALQKHLWFHEDALKYRPSLYGIRLSFALADWVELGEKYPKARRALVAVRDKNRKALTDGKGSYELFHDVAAINDYLKEGAATVELFKTLHRKFPKLAGDCYRVAEPNLVARREYLVCIHYLADPHERFDEIKGLREERLKQAKEEVPKFARFAEEEFVEESRRLVGFLAGAGRPKDAVKVRDQALAVRNDADTRAPLAKALRRPKDQGKGWTAAVGRGMPQRSLA